MGWLLWILLAGVACAAMAAALVYLASRNSTATNVCMMRFLATKQPPPLQGRDELAFYMLPQRAQRLCAFPLSRAFYQAWARRAGVFHSVNARTIFGDSVLERLLREQGPFGQLVVMGAGFDTRAYRFQQLLTQQGVTAFELDLPHTQNEKKARLISASKALVAAGRPAIDSSHVRYIATDFNLGDLPGLLKAEGFDPSKRSIFVMEGVFTYLPPEVADNTVRLLKSLSAPGSFLICTMKLGPKAISLLQRSDFAAYKAAISAPDALERLQQLGVSRLGAHELASLAKKGEPHLFMLHDSAAVQQFFSNVGCSVAEQLSPAQVYQKYCGVPFEQTPKVSRAGDNGRGSQALLVSLA